MYKLERERKGEEREEIERTATNYHNIDKDLGNKTVITVT